MSIPYYWLGIMAVAFAGAMTLWIVLVFRAGRTVPHRPLESEPHREVIGGAFEAREGGRQVMPDPVGRVAPPVVPPQANRRAAQRVRETSQQG
ncbi:MAG: hypothetical protein LBV34_11055 [Nocardiopsaceae bacterium]|jgi:hypothetical protein|nr:hypothetical protein [Nocardiopsaceae bacterium]